ncbi:TFIID and SAGA subunit TAF61 [Apiospora hydei]|uniref:TFIID and SAGA subunit TAF61 n=1 Tax=Apiospora hydei TaxID=1337664 RepID=A0ABR1V378_9PEZI
MTLPPTPLAMKTHPNPTSTTTTTATTTTATNPSTPTRPRSTTATTKGRPRSRSTSPCCPHCGNSLPFLSVSDPHTALLEAQKQIADLEAQVHLLNKKATAAVDRWADYEDELSRLRAASLSSNAPTVTTSSGLGIMMNPGSTTNRNSRPSTAVTEAPSPRGSGFFGGSVAQAASSRISQLLSPRKSTPNLAANNNHTTNNANAQQAAAVTRASFMTSSATTNNNNSSSLHPHPLPSPTPSADDLVEALAREQSLRQAAEGRLNETSREVEELSVTLFEQANEMVASERRARAQLEERVGVLERREDEKRGRLERLEGSVARIERISRILGEDDEEGYGGASGKLAPPPR